MATISPAAATAGEADGQYQYLRDTQAIYYGPFVVSERNGVWGTAEPVPGLPAGGGVGQVSCSPQGTCTIMAGLDGQALTLSETNGTWDTTPKDIPGTAGLVGVLTSLSCPSAGNCSRRIDLPLLAAEHDGTWAKGRQAARPRSAQPRQGLPGVDHQHLLRRGRQLRRDRMGQRLPHPALVRTEAFVINEVAGRWHFARSSPA